MSNFNIVSFLKQVAAINASDAHLYVGEYPAVRRDGKIIKIDMPVLTEEDIRLACEEIVPEHLRSKLDVLYDFDFSYEIKGVVRCRVNVSRQFAKLAIVIRFVPYNIKMFQELHLPETITQFAQLENGLVLVTGPTGSGKSTTIASLIEYINLNYPKHVITIEDPVEFVFTSKKSIVSQRQLVVDTPDFSSGIKYALRQDPDVIFIGEIRDVETMTNAMRAAETGHLVFATIHTNNVIQTVNRIVNMYNPSDRLFVRSQLAEVLRGTISQKLVPLASGTGRRPACEVLVVTPTVKDFIVKDELEQVYDLIKNGSFNSMITLNMSLYDMIKNSYITEETGLSVSDNVNELKQMLRGVYHGTGK